ncbi:MAG: antibiotic biosynthesis monooxygenase [bacterium]|nr:antibiotic biosynthesis monooxygenase [bacterium]
MSEIAKTPEPPYYVTIFANQRTLDDELGYQEMAARMNELAMQQPGFLGADSARDGDGFGITVSYWRDEGSIQNWRERGEHAEAQQRGKHNWYAEFSVRIARVERAYDFKK